MKDLEEIYEENFLFPPSRSYKQLSIKEEIEKIQGLLGSLKLSLQILRHNLEEREDQDNGFSETVETVENALETPSRIFDRTFFANREKF